MLNKKGLCIQCNEAISNPVCEQCYLKQINSWIRETNINKKDRGLILKEIKSAFKSYDLVDTGINCILCNKEVSKICFYCLFLETHGILMKHGVSEIDIESFLDTFNYRHFYNEYEESKTGKEVYKRYFIQELESRIKFFENLNRTGG